jgi:hypothetical protein
MSPNAFINKPKQPTEAELVAALGLAKPVWDQLLTDLAREFDVTVHEWNCYSPKAGWSLRVKRKGRTIVWLGPRKGAFMAAFILGDRAMLAARRNKLPQRVVQTLNEAPKYPEGTGVRLEVKSARDITTLKKLAAIKLAN